MKVKVNDTIVRVHSGAKVMDALRAYMFETGKDFPLSALTVYDKWGNEIDLDGSIQEQTELVVTTDTNECPI
ncbi:hypothetical protein [Porphyromonas sp.]|uniref:hypothetical protein n=1 Tax=Porphyromonas sp. TaxID=1924944 RepID=UPI0026DBBE4D|nr:hypothetical protein [Porphyromonas sp.]MDO4695117.1 hypothetical protein [Porphyromonas sp.]MDO4770238.1 hypothetical protein [Porphyromonas sp.]